MKPIVVVGSINMDLVCETEHHPEPGQTVMGTSFAPNPGGKGANQAVAVARLRSPSILLGAVGDDSFGHELCTTLESYGVTTSHLHQAKGSFIALADGAGHKIGAFPADAVDTTAAGDALHGAFAVSLMRGSSVEESGRFASAAVSVTRKGAQSSLAGVDEVQFLLDRMETE